ncbi:nucleoside-diphosphate kinase [Candidatus Nomurabacteria bacterium]|nr:nucleoside-diphosphate kinase [Candidatus Nomurabacteria bacterium]
MDFKDEKTLVIIKPDGVQRSLIGEIIGRLERVGLKLIGMKMIVPAEDHVRAHYSIDPEWKKKVGEKAIESYKKKGQQPPSENPEEVGDKVIDVLVNYIASGPVVVMAWQGAHSVGIVRKIVGGTEPLSSDVGTIRGDFVLDSYQMADTDQRAVRNLIHASGSVEEANQELPHWFSEEELLKYRLIQEEILYDVNLDGLLE